MFDVVLLEPEIPPNTGNIIRLCANTGARLHLVEPLGFAMRDRELKRAGLDYHEYAQVTVHPDLDQCLQGRERIFAFSTHAERSCFDADFATGDTLLFGAETRGLPEDVRNRYAAADRLLRLPMVAGSRSLNLSNAVAVVVYEAWRQCGFAGSK